MIKEWLERRRLEREADYYDSGWNWANAEILKGSPPDTLYAFIPDGSHHSFDRGAIDRLGQSGERTC
jgi:hypothetical protein